MAQNSKKAPYSPWFKVSYIEGFLSMVCGCFGGSKPRTLNSKFPMVQSLIHPGLSLNGMWVFWWLTHPYFESQIADGSYMQGCPSVVSGCSGGSKPRTLNRKFLMAQSLLELGLAFSGIWVLWWLRNPYLESQIPNGSKSPTIRVVPQWYLGALVAHKPVL